MIALSSQKTALYFGKEKLTALFLLCLSTTGFLTQFIYSRFFMKIKHSYKIIFVSGGYSALFALFSSAYYMPNDIGFAVTVACTCAIGCLTVVGANTIIGFMKTFPPESINGYSSGVGFSGLLGGCIYLVLKRWLAFKWILLIAIPSFLLYILAFFWMVKIKADIEKAVIIAEAHGEIEPLEEYESTKSTEVDLNRALEEGVMEEVLEEEAEINNNLNV